MEVAAPSLHDLAPQVEPARELAFEQMRATRTFQPEAPDDESDA
jgi:hypothetical protein